MVFGRLLRQFSIRTRMLSAIAMVLTLLAVVGSVGILGMHLLKITPAPVTLAHGSPFRYIVAHTPDRDQKSRRHPITSASRGTAWK